MRATAVSWCAAACMLVLFSGCTSTAGYRKLDALLARPVTFNQALYSGELWEANALYRKGLDLLHQHQPEAALAVFKEHVRLYPKHELSPILELRIGQAYEELADWQRAADHYSRYLRTSLNPFERPEHYLATAKCYFNAGNYAEALHYLEEVEHRARLSNQDEILLYLRRGLALYGLRRLDEAEQQLLLCMDYIELYKKYLPGVEPPEIAQAYAILGGISMERMLTEKLPAGVWRDEFLESKVDLLEKAERYLVKAIEAGDAEAAISALGQLAGAYEKLWDQLSAAVRVKTDLQREERDAALLSIKKQLLPLLDKAVYLHHRTAAFAQQLNLPDHPLRTASEQSVLRLLSLREQLQRDELPRVPTVPSGINP